MKNSIFFTYQGVDYTVSAAVFAEAKYYYKVINDLKSTQEERERAVKFFELIKVN
jgi:hypothetical protein